MSETVTIGDLTVALARPTTDGRGGADGAPPRPPLVLVHGLCAGAWIWAKYQRLLADRGYTSYALDLRGHHASRPVPAIGQVSVHDYVEDVLDVIRSLGELPVVIGHSLGGLLAQKVAEAGAARAAVLVCSAPPAGIPVTNPRLLLRQLKHARAVFGARPLLGTRDDNDALNFNHVPIAERAELHERFVPDSGRAARELTLGTIRVDPARVRCPVLSVSAADDRFVAPAIGRRIAERYGAPYRLFAGHGHLMVWEPGWETPAAEIERWVATTVAAGGGAERAAPVAGVTAHG
jgi:non-heme chloroperoxidase